MGPRCVGEQIQVTGGLRRVRGEKSGSGSELIVLLQFPFGCYEPAKVLVVSKGFLLDSTKMKEWKEKGWNSPLLNSSAWAQDGLEGPRLSEF